MLHVNPWRNGLQAYRISLMYSFTDVLLAPTSDLLKEEGIVQTVADHVEHIAQMTDKM